jgi:prepilin-type processing-associated H-X9-DG protein
MMSECVGLRDDNQTQLNASWQGPVGDIAFATGGQTFNGSLTPNSTTPDTVCLTGWASTLTTPSLPNYLTILNGMPAWNTSISGITMSILFQQFAARSKHTGGVNALFCDGSVRFAPDTVDLGVWMAQSTSRNGARWLTPLLSTTARMMPVEPGNLNTY